MILWGSIALSSPRQVPLAEKVLHYRSPPNFGNLKNNRMQKLLKRKYRARVEAFRLIRYQRGLSQQICADFCLCGQGFWNHIERGSITIAHWRARRIAQFLGVKTDEIFSVVFVPKSVYCKNDVPRSLRI